MRKCLGFIFEKNKRERFLESISGLFLENRTQVKEVSVTRCKIIITSKERKNFFSMSGSYLNKTKLGVWFLTQEKNERE